MGMNPRKNRRYHWGRYWRMKGHVTARLVEDCPAILDHAHMRQGGVVVMQHPTMFPPAAIGFVLVRRTGCGTIVVNHDGEVTEIPLLYSPGKHAGWQEWFACPQCGKRVRKLYKPAGETFACRDCHHLTYRKQQKHKCHDEAFPVDPHAVLRSWQAVNQQIRALGLPAVEIPSYIQRQAEPRIDPEIEWQRQHDALIRRVLAQVRRR